MLKDCVEDYVIIGRNGKPFIKITLVKPENTSNRIGIAKGLFTVPENFDNIVISEDFEGDIF